jgi:hypothetical protein
MGLTNSMSFPETSPLYQKGTSINYLTAKILKGGQGDQNLAASRKKPEVPAEKSVIYGA